MDLSISPNTFETKVLGSLTLYILMDFNVHFLRCCETNLGWNLGNYTSNQQGGGRYTQSPKMSGLATAVSRMMFAQRKNDLPLEFKGSPATLFLGGIGDTPLKTKRRNVQSTVFSRWSDYQDHPMGVLARLPYPSPTPGHPDRKCLTHTVTPYGPGTSRNLWGTTWNWTSTYPVETELG